MFCIILLLFSNYIAIFRNMEKIIGRDDEKKIFNTIYSKLSSQLVAIYGRRRVGKTFLIRNSFCDKGFYFEVTGIKKGPIEFQISNFVDAIADSFLNGELPNEKPKNWMEAFSLLKNTIRDLRKNSEAKITLFF